MNLYQRQNQRIKVYINRMYENLLFGLDLQKESDS